MPRSIPPTPEDEALLEAAEDVRLARAHGEAPPEPQAYDERYRPPAHRIKLLQQRHEHERDRRIHFLEGPHLYIVDEKPLEISVTGIVSAHTEPFDADRIVAVMAAGRGQAWPRLAYAVNTVACDAPRGGMVLLVSDDSGKTLWAGFAPEAATVEWGLERARKRERAVRSVTWYTFERAMTVEEIKTKWSRNATEKANLGTEAHLCMELWANSEPCRWCAELRNGLRFVRDHLLPLGAKAFRTEWEIFAETEGFAGSVDFVAQLPDGSLVIVDWKRTEKHEVHSAFNKTMSAPLSHLDDVDVCKFCLQLSTYQYVLETYYGYTVTALALCSIHPEHPFVFFAPYLEKEVKYLMAKRRERMALKVRLEFEDVPDAPRCSLTGDIAWDPVRVNGELCDAKAAAWRHPDEEAVPDADAKARVAALEATVTTSGPSAEEVALEGSVPWRQLVAAEGRPAYAPCRA